MILHQSRLLLCTLIKYEKKLQILIPAILYFATRVAVVCLD